MHADHVNKSEIKIRTIHRRNKLFGMVRLSNWRRILNHVFKAFKAGFLVEYIMLEVSTVIGCYMGKMSSLQFLNEKNWNPISPAMQAIDPLICLSHCCCDKCHLPPLLITYFTFVTHATKQLLLFCYGKDWIKLEFLSFMWMRCEEAWLRDSVLIFADLLVFCLITLTWFVLRINYMILLSLSLSLTPPPKKKNPHKP